MNSRALLWLLAATGLLLLWAWLFVARAGAFDNAGAMAIATDHYGQPCAGSVSVQWDHLGDTVNARSSWWSVPGEPPSTYTRCTITYSLDVPWDPEKFCTVTEHETGHLTGHQHGEDPIMDAYYTVPSPECTAAYPPRVAWRPGPTERPRAKTLDSRSNPRYASTTKRKIPSHRRHHERSHHLARP